MVKLFQVTYGYSLVLSLFYVVYMLFLKVTGFSFNLSMFFLLAVLMLLPIRVRPSSESLHYPFSFQIQLFFRH